MKYEVLRDVTTDECHWLKEDVKAGTIVYKYNGATYGCIGPGGVACCMVEGENPFFELPYVALRSIE